MPKRKFPLRLSEAFGNLPSESPDYEGEYQEADEALQVTKAHGFRSVGRLCASPLPAIPRADPAAPSTVLCPAR